MNSSYEFQSHLGESKNDVNFNGYAQSDLIEKECTGMITDSVHQIRNPSL